MQDKFLEQTRHEYSPKQRFVFLLFLAPIFLFVIALSFHPTGGKA